MKYAVDRYGVDLEKEVSADIFYNKYIAQRDSRFFCPECGEPVFWSSRGGPLPDRFSHYKRTERTPEWQEAILDKKVQFSSLNTSNALMIDELVRMNTDAEKELKGILSQNGFYPYNFMFTKLKENLAKRI